MRRSAVRTVRPATARPTAAWPRVRDRRSGRQQPSHDGNGDAPRLSASPPGKPSARAGRVRGGLRRFRPHGPCRRRAGAGGRGRGTHRPASRTRHRTSSAYRTHRSTIGHDVRCARSHKHRRSPSPPAPAAAAPSARHRKCPLGRPMADPHRHTMRALHIIAEHTHRSPCSSPTSCPLRQRTVVEEVVQAEGCCIAQTRAFRESGPSPPSPRPQRYSRGSWVR